MRLNSRFDASHHGPPHPIEGASSVADGRHAPTMPLRYETGGEASISDRVMWWTEWYLGNLPPPPRVFQFICQFMFQRLSTFIYHAAIEVV
jgi:hypothetical protein